MAILGRNCFGCITSVRVGRVAQMYEYLIHHCSAHEPESFVLQHFEHGNALKIHNEILFKLGKRKTKALDIHMHFCGFSQHYFIFVFLST